MERIQSINPKRIEWCCEDRGVTIAEFAADIGIPESSIEKVMRGEPGLTFSQLQKVANYFNRGVLFFLEPETVNEAQVHTPQFRTIANQKPEISAKVKALIERVERQRDLYLNLREELSRGGQSFALPALPKDQSQAATVVRKWLSLADKNDFNTYREAIEAREILVFRSNGYTGAWQIAKESPICGFSLYNDTCPVIVVKKQTYESRQTFSLMHELGHVLMHQSSFIDEETDLYAYQGREHEANAFAGYLLVPDVFLKTIDDKGRPADVARYDAWLQQYRERWGVSTEVILRRLLDAGRLKKELYETYRQWREKLHNEESAGGSRKYRYREPKHVFGDPFVRTILDALSAKHISLAKASTYLDNLKVKDVHRLEDLYAHL